METIVEVTLWGNKVGVLAWDQNKEIGIFEFYNTFPSLSLDIAPLTMPLDLLLKGDCIFNFPQHRGKTFKGLPGIIADSLPDDYGNAIIDEYFASLGFATIDINPVDRLCYIGTRGMGALEFQPARYNTFLNGSRLISGE